MTTMSDLSYTERLEVERLAREIESGIGVGTIDLGKAQGGRGKRHRYRAPLERLLGYKVDYGVQYDDDGQRFGWFARHEEDNAVDPEQQAARERLGFAQ